MRFLVGLGIGLLVVSAYGADLRVTVRGCPTGTLVRVALFDSAAHFPGKLDGLTALRRQTVTAGTAGAELAFASLTPGRYALAAYADLNGNGKLDSNFVGKPTEPYGFSRDVRSWLSAPSFEQAAFAIGEDDVTLTLHLE